MSSFDYKIDLYWESYRYKKRMRNTTPITANQWRFQDSGSAEPAYSSMGSIQEAIIEGLGYDRTYARHIINSL